MSLFHRFEREDRQAAQEASFEGFWSLYPRKVAKLEALKAWKQMTRDYDPAEILAGLRSNLPSMMRKEKQFVKHPASWLRAGCWMDEPADHAPARAAPETDLQRLSREMRERNGSDIRDHGRNPSVVPLFPSEWEGR